MKYFNGDVKATKSLPSFFQFFNKETNEITDELEQKKLEKVVTAFKEASN
ncbi:MAG: hypothetical protein HRT71_03315 [Flavobacteriales bacterium]|nr:hypothetical protein [Flavobacteriales bacterium]